MKNEIYRLKFIKMDRMRFIGHLDLLKLFLKTIKRSDLPVAYSEGFNPHQKISFALPLPLGFSSVGEYVDIQFTDELDVLRVKNILNSNLPEGVNVTKIIKVNEKRNAASILSAASYTIEFPFKEDFSSCVKNILDEKEILIEKKNKKGKVNLIDIRSDIFSLEKGFRNKVYMLISAGSEKNLKPEIITKLILEQLNMDYEEYKYKVKYTRMEMFRLENSTFIGLDGVEEFNEKVNC